MENENAKKDKKFPGRVIFSGWMFTRLVVTEPSADKYEAFTRWLDENGYSLSAGARFQPEYHSIFIDPQTGLFSLGETGDNLVTALGGHDITPDDFKRIHAIFSRYHGLPVGVFPEN